MKVSRSLNRGNKQKQKAIGKTWWNKTISESFDRYSDEYMAEHAKVLPHSSHCKLYDYRRCTYTMYSSAALTFRHILH